MSKWKDLDLESKLTLILRNVPDLVPEHHLGRPYLTAYQIAIEFARLYPDETAQLGFPIGGAGTGEHNSLAQYLARQLSGHIDQLPHIEGGFLSDQHLKDISFDAGGRPIHASRSNTNYVTSIFKIKK